MLAKEFQQTADALSNGQNTPLRCERTEGDDVNPKRHVLWALLVTTGCTPYASYTHLSDPRIAGDGYDLVCAGGIYRKANFEARTAGCYNAAPLHGEFIKVDISYVWDGRDGGIPFAGAAEDDDRRDSRSSRVANAGRSSTDGEF